MGLCGSDLHWFAEGGIGDEKVTSPLVLGHEFSGVPEDGPYRGRLVAVDPAMPCGECARCLEGNPNLCSRMRFAGHGPVDGGLQEYVAWPTAQLVPVPESFSPAAAALLEPLGVAVHCWGLGHGRVGSRVVIVGGGPIGLLLLQVALAAGASEVVVVEPLAHRREAALKFGASSVLEPAAARGAGVQADIAFEAAGHNDAIIASMSMVRSGARVVLVGIPSVDTISLPSSLARSKGLTVLFDHRMGHTYPMSIDLVRRNAVDLDSLVTDRSDLAGSVDAFGAAVSRGGLKTVIDVSR